MEDHKPLKAAVVTSVNGYDGPAVILHAYDLDAYTKEEVDAIIAKDVTWADIQDKPDAFPPTIATADAVGGVKPGSNTTIAADGTISVPNPDWSSVQNKPTAYPPTQATVDAIGGVKPGNGMVLGADGSLSVIGAETRPFSFVALGSALKPNTGTWVVPDGVVKFNVTIVGSGGTGGNAIPTGGAVTGGGGGGGGGWARTTFYGYAPGTSFSYQAGGAGAGSGNDASWFAKTASASTPLLYAGAGQDGGQGNRDGGSIAAGGAGGSVKTNVEANYATAVISGWGIPGQPGWATSGNKRIGGTGGHSLWGGGRAINGSDDTTCGCGSAGVGDNQGTYYSPSSGAVIIEW